MRARGEGGTTLTEVSVAILIMGLVASLLYAATDSTTEIVGRVDDESRGLADMRIVIERMSRDLRAGRGIEAYPQSDRTKLVMWIDKDSDFQRADDEVFTWRLASSGSSGQYSVLRSNAASLQQTVGHYLVSDIAFSYSPGTCDPAPCVDPTFGHRPTSTTNTVRVEMSYDAIPGLYSSPKLVSFDVRLRNAE